MTGTKKRVLFVDDEPLVLQGLQRLLRPLRTEWEMSFVETGAAALQLMAEVPFQIIVSDMRMPGMNGAQLLAKVQELYPQTVRLILSGHADKELILKCVGTAHQFLAKPCDPAALRNAIARGCEFDALLNDDKMKQLIARMDSLPSVPALLKEIIERLNQEDCGIEEIAAVINKDLGMTAKLLKLVNSAFFGLRREVSSPDDAVTYLGIATIKSLVLAVNAFSSFGQNRNGPIPVEALWAHSAEVSHGSQQIAHDVGASKRECSEILIAGLLHDVGKLALAANLPEQYVKVVQASREEKLPLYIVEERVFGANHAEIGRFLLSLWGLPPDVVNTIGHHHDPASCPDELRTSVLALHVAECFSRMNRPHADGMLNRDYIERMGFSDRIEHWKKLLQ